MCTRYLTEFSSPESDDELPVDVEPATNSEIGKVIFKAVSTDPALGIVLNAIWNRHRGYSYLESLKNPGTGDIATWKV